MNYYEHHIGDFDADTAHLTWAEDMAYTRLIRLYYRREKPIPSDISEACRLVRAMAKDQKQAVHSVLNEFFTLTSNGWTQARCESEIAVYQKKVEHNRTVGKLGGRPKKTTTQAEPRNNPPGSFREPKDNPPHTPDPSHQTNSVPDGTDGGAVKPATDLTKDELWSAGKSLLAQSGMPAKQCGSFVGGLVKQFGDQVVVEAVRLAVVARPADPVEYLKATCMRSVGQRQNVNRQEALEERGQRIVDEWANSGVIDAAA